MIYLPADRPKFAITCGKKMKAKTTIAENHKRKVLIRLGLQLHCLARQDLYKPRAMNITDSTSRYGRNCRVLRPQAAIEARESRLSAYRHSALQEVSNSEFRKVSILAHVFARFAKIVKAVR
jgi:hypothetical protein